MPPGTEPAIPTWPVAIGKAATLVAWAGLCMVGGVLLTEVPFRLGRHWAARPPSWAAVAAIVAGLVGAVILAGAAIYRWAAISSHRAACGADDGDLGGPA